MSKEIDRGLEYLKDPATTTVVPELKEDLIKLLEKMRGDDEKDITRVA